MKETNKIIMAIDRRPIKYKDLIGSVLTTADGKVLLSYYGQPTGHDPHSFRFEACVFLVATRFIFLRAEPYNELITDSINISNKIHLYTNSLSMIKD